MDKHFSAGRTRYLWQQWTDGVATPSEVDELFVILQDPSFKEKLHDILGDQSFPSGTLQQLDEDRKREMLQRILVAANEPVRKKTGKLTIMFKYAAAAAIVLSFGVYLYLNKKQVLNNEPHELAQNAVTHDVNPGSNKAKLKLDDGTEVELGSEREAGEKGQFIKDGDLSIENYDNTLSYSSSFGKPKFHTLSTPNGGQYSLVLPDGSRVWLNAASSITYPTAFTASTREVSITGEAYFEVSKDRTRPFTVSTYNDKITVLGTSFNVNSYTDEKYVRTSLLEGSVAVGNSRLEPGEVYMNGNKFKANVYQDVAWKNGAFAFSNADLQAVMRQLARWYNLQIVYEGKIPEGKFSGEIGRSLTLNQLLKGLSITNIKYRLDNENRLVIIPD